MMDFVFGFFIAIVLWWVVEAVLRAVVEGLSTLLGEQDETAK